MKLQFCAIVLLAFLGPLLVPVSCAPVNADPDVTIEKIFQVWKKRQEQVRSARFQWTASMTYVKETLLSTPSTEERLKGAMPKALPAQDVTHTVRGTLSFDAERIRSELVGTQWKEARGEFLPSHYAVVINGPESHTLYAPGPNSYPQGFVDNQHHIGFHQRPFLDTYRPFHTTVGKCRNPKAWVLSGAPGIVDGHACLILEKLPEGDEPAVMRMSFWVDPERDFSILRYVLTVRGAVYRQSDISYRHDPAFGWVPSRWTHALFNEETSKLEESTTAQVTEYAFNVPIAEDQFRPPYPPGTQVRDFRNDEEYLVREGGEKRIITRQERLRGATHDDLLASESGMGGLGRGLRWWQSWRLWFGLGLGLLALIAIAGWLLWRKNAAPEISR